MVTADRENKARVWDPQTGQQVGPAVEHVRCKPSEEAYYQTDPVLSPDGTLLLTNTTTALTLWGMPIANPTVLVNGRATGFQFSQDGKTAVVVMGSSVTVLLDLSAQEAAADFFHPRRAYGAALSPDSRMLATTSSGGLVTVWDVLSKQRLFSWPVGTMSSGCGSRQWPVAPGRGTGWTTRIWDVAEGCTCRSCPTPSIAAVPTCRVHSKTGVSPDGQIRLRFEAEGPGSSAALRRPGATAPRHAASGRRSIQP